jgi:predicted RNA binding protein YcfA (HicA-like mRNA interferase family)
VKAREIIRMIEADGWRFLVQRGSHRHYVHPIKPGKVTVPMHAGKDLQPGTVHSILKQAGLR